MMHRYFLNKLFSVRKKELLYLGEPNPIIFKNRNEMIRWYSEKARVLLKERVEYYSRMTGWQPTSISVTRAVRRWGSCGPKNSINFSWRLPMTPLHVIDYVVVHELAHIPEKNHSRRFWDKVQGVLPEFNESRKWLKIHEPRMID